MMEILHPCCAGLDVHKDSVVACVRRATADAGVQRRLQTFATTTAQLLALSQWLSDNAVTHVAMEATGVYWKPVWHVLADGEFALTLANAAHIKAVPGRKTDVNDATWIADLLAHGLIRASFVPPQPTQDLRTLMRTRKQLVREQASHVQRLHKTLHDANIKLDAAIADIVGLSGRRMIEAIIAGQADPDALAALAHRRVKASQQQLRDALHGRVTDHHRFLLRLHLQQVDTLTQLIAEIDARVGQHLDSFRAAVDQLISIPGVSQLSARTILAEIGTDMSVFASAGHLLAWSGMCPTNNQSAAKARPARLRKGSTWLKSTLVQCAWAATRTRKGYLPAQFARLAARMGRKKAICAVAASILTAIYHMLSDGTLYRDLGADHFARRAPQRTANSLVRKLVSLGFDVHITPLNSSP